MTSDSVGHYTIPKQRRVLPAVLLALVMHALLGLFLFFGLNWQSHTADAVDAELWSALPQVAAPQPTAPPPEPPPAPLPQPVKVTPPPEPAEQPEQADIQIKAPVPKKPPLPKPPPPAPEPKPEPKAVKAPPPPPPPPQVQRPPSAMAALQALAAAPSTGTAAQTSGPKGDPSYEGKIRNVIRSHTTYVVPAGVNGNPEVQIRIQLLPSGEVRNVDIEKSSGYEAFDTAVERGILASSPLPRDANGRVPENGMTITYKMSDLQR